MADVYGVVVGATTVGANTRTTEVGVDHGTPALAFINVALTGIETTFANSNSTFHLVTAALDGFAEMYGIGTPDSGNCVFVVHANTLNSGAVDGTADGSFAAMEAAIDAATGGSSTVTELSLSGNSLA